LLKMRGFHVSHIVADDIGLPFSDRKKQALASYIIRRMQQPGAPRPQLTTEFFHALESRKLPTPEEASDNMILWLAETADGSPGTALDLPYTANPGY
jgi:hypothetical protein